MDENKTYHLVSDREGDLYLLNPKGEVIIPPFRNGETIEERIKWMIFAHITYPGNIDLTSIAIDSEVPENVSNLFPCPEKILNYFKENARKTIEYSSPPISRPFKDEFRLGKDSSKGPLCINDPYAIRIAKKHNYFNNTKQI